MVSVRRTAIMYTSAPDALTIITDFTCAPTLVLLLALLLAVVAEAKAKARRGRTRRVSRSGDYPHSLLQSIHLQCMLRAVQATPMGLPLTLRLPFPTAIRHSQFLHLRLVLLQALTQALCLLLLRRLFRCPLLHLVLNLLLIMGIRPPCALRGPPGTISGRMMMRRGLLHPYK